jgi:hypothetical protein
MRLMIDNRTFFIDFSTHRTHSLTFRHGAATQLTDSFPGQLWFSSRFKIRVDDEVPLFFVHRVMMPPDTFTAIAVYAFFVFFDFCGLFVYPQNRLVRRLVFRSRRRPQHESVPPNPIFRRSRVWRREFQKLFNVQSKRTKYSTFRLIQGVGSAIFTFFFLSSSSSVVVFLGPPPPAELWVVLLPDLIEAAINRFLSLSLSVCVSVCLALNRGWWVPPAPPRGTSNYTISNVCCPFFFWVEDKREKTPALASKTQLRGLTKTQKSAIHKDRISIFNLLLSLQIEGKRESSQGI